MPGLCRPIEDGGIGFDYRLNMSIPDMWIKLLKETKDEDWKMSDISFNLTNRRWNEKHVTYSESHDQAIVGDKTISMWLFDKEIYDNMSLMSHETLTISRGMNLHKMIRLITIALGGESYLNFEGNEFGHPEWLDFPRDGNNHSYKHCRRQFNLADDELLRYKQLLNFDNKMLDLIKHSKCTISNHQYISLNHEDDKIIVFEKGTLLFIFNFHPSKSFEGYKVGTQMSKPHKIVLNTDSKFFGGHERIHENYIYEPVKEKYFNRDYSFQIYIPSRCAIVLESDW